MKFFNKISIALILLIFAIGMVSAVSIHDFTYPNTFTKMDDGDGYINDMGQGMIVYKYDDSSKQLFLTNHDHYEYDYYENNIYAFADGDNQLVGILELVEYKGEKFIVISTILYDNLDTDTGYAYDNLMEFNKLNNVKPLTI